MKILGEQFQTHFVLPLLLGCAIAISFIPSFLYPGAWDDAYISFVYVINAAAGHGLTYNGEWVQGFSNPLWVLLLTGFAKLGTAPPETAIALGWFFGAATLITITLLSRRFGLSGGWALLPAVLLAFNIDYSYHLGKGLETSLFTFLVTLLSGVTLLARARISSALLVGIIGGLVALTRPEGFFLSVGAGVLLLIRTRARYGVVALLTSIIVAMPWYLWAHSVYGAWLPNPIYAKVGTIGWDPLRSGISYLFPYSLSGAVAVAFYLLLAGICCFSHCSLLRYMTAIVLIWSIFIIAVGGDYIPSLRFLAPMLPLTFLAISLYSARHISSRRAILFLFIPLIFIITRWCDPYRRSLATQNQYYQTLWREVSLWLRDNASPDSLIAVDPAGIIPYYSGLRTIDMLGLNNFHIAHYGKKDPSRLPGHQSGDGRYVLSRAPDYIMFGARGGLKPSGLISDREIYASPSYHTLYYLFDDPAFYNPNPC